MKRRIGSFFAAILMLASTLVGMSPVHAAYTQDDNFFNSNEILLYCKKTDDPNNKCGQNVCSGDSTTSDVAVGDLSDLKPSDTLQTIFQDLTTGGMNAVQASAVMGNMYWESHFKADQEEIGGGGGYGLVQWTGGRRTNLENYAAAQGQPVSSVDLQMKFLLKEYNDTYKGRLAGSSFATGTNVDAATKSWMQIFEDPLQVGSDPAKLNSERIPAAEKIYDFYSDSASSTPATNAAATSSCSGNSGSDATAGNGNIVKTALSLAWPQSKGIADGDNAVSDATTAYQKAKPKYDPEGLISDCGAFVSVVMRMSGVDPDFPQLHVTLMDDYVREHPDKYKIIDHPTDADLKSGDLLIEYSDDHIVISQGAGQPNIDASNGFRVPSVRPDGSDLYMLNEGSFIARYIGGTKT